MARFPSSDSLNATFEAAQRQAALATKAAPIEWDRDRRAAARRRGLGLAAASIAALSVVIAVAFVSDEQPAPARVVPTSPVGEVARTSSAADVPGVATIAPTADTSRPDEPVRRSGESIEMSFANVPLREAVRLLAAKTHARVHGQENLVTGAATIDLAWRGTGAKQAWSALLTGVSNAAVSCDATSCDVWLLRSGFPLPPGMTSAPGVGEAPQIAHPAPSSVDTTDDGMPK
jgi:hypothetical protein